MIHAWSSKAVTSYILTIGTWDMTPGVHLPTELLEEVRWKEGDRLRCDVFGGEILVQRVPADQPTAEDLFAGITEEDAAGIADQAKEFAWGPDVGAEILELGDQAAVDERSTHTSTTLRTSELRDVLAALVDALDKGGSVSIHRSLPPDAVGR